MRKNKIIGYGFTILLISILVIIGVVISIPKPKEPIEDVIIRADLPTDDITVKSNEPYYTENIDTLLVGCFDMKYKWSMIRFDLTNKPENWSSCEIQIYISEIINAGYYEPICRYGLHMDYNNWNEDSDYSEIKWGDWDHSVDFNGSYSKIFDCKLGFLKVNITNYIENHETITIRFKNIYPDVFDYHSYVYYNIHSKEANVDIEYKPQLIWSKITN